MSSGALLETSAGSLARVHAQNIGSGGVGPSGDIHSGETPAFCRALDPTFRA